MAFNLIGFDVDFFGWHGIIIVLAISAFQLLACMVDRIIQMIKTDISLLPRLAFGD